MPTLLSTGPQDKLWKLLIEIKEQNKQILARLTKSDGASSTARTPDDMPVHFPLTSINEVLALETYLIETSRISELVRSILINFVVIHFYFIFFSHLI